MCFGVLKLKEHSRNFKAKSSTIATVRTLVCSAKLDVLAVNAICSSILDEVDIGLDTSRKLESDATDCRIGSKTLLNLWK